MRKKLRASPALLVAAAALVVALGGVAYAGIPGSQGVIYGCYDSGGNLKVIKSGQSCARGFTSLNWNQSGPQGPQGPAGATGQQGPQGPPGATDVFWTDTKLTTVIPDNPLPGNTPTVAKLTLPPGKYLVTSNATATIETETVFNCTIQEGPNGAQGSGPQTVDLGSHSGVVVNTWAQAPVDLPTGGVVHVVCVSNPYDYSQAKPDSNGLMSVWMSAVKVGTLTQQ
jgi:hypothetical protein